jgi:hypothetical protein
VTIKCISTKQVAQTLQTPRIDKGPRTSLLTAHLLMPNVMHVPATPPNVAAVADSFADLDELPVPIFSTMNNGLLSTFVALLGEFKCNGLGQYVGLVGHRKHWTNSQKNALSKRLYLYDQIASAAQVIGSRNGQYHDTPFAQQASSQPTSVESRPLVTCKPAK